MQLEVLEVIRRSSTHSVHHFLAQLHRWWQWLRVTAKNEPEIYVEQFACK